MPSDNGPMNQRPLFCPGRLLISPGALEICEKCRIDALTLLARHLVGDWGVVCDADKARNDLAVMEGTRIISAYPIDGRKAVKGHGDNALWVITEADRSATTILLPDEY